jgi:hypothetical protein
MTKRYLAPPVFLPQSSSAKSLSTKKTTEKLDKYLVYPNPVSDVLYINGSEQENFKIFNQIGTLILSGNGSEIDVSNLNTGMYIFISEGKRPVKFIKK